MSGGAAAVVSCVRISSALEDSYRARLEELLFFNPGQERVAEGIEASIARHGLPEVAAERGLLHIGVGAHGRVQALYALEAREAQDELVGVIVYCRPSADEIVVLHIAVSERFASTGPMADVGVALRLFQSVRQAAARLKGVRWLSMYRGGGLVRFPVCPAVTA